MDSADASIGVFKILLSGIPYTIYFYSLSLNSLRIVFFKEKHCRNYGHCGRWSSDSEFSHWTNKKSDHGEHITFQANILTSEFLNHIAASPSNSKWFDFWYMEKFCEYGSDFCVHKENKNWILLFFNIPVIIWSFSIDTKTKDYVVFILELIKTCLCL